MILFRKQLLVDTDAQEIARVKQLLSSNGIRYEVKTLVSENVLSRSFNSAAAVRLRHSYDDMSRQSYVYKLYVPLNSFAAAKALIGTKEMSI